MFFAVRLNLSSTDAYPILSPITTYPKSNRQGTNMLRPLFQHLMRQKIFTLPHWLMKAIGVILVIPLLINSRGNIVGWVFTVTFINLPLLVIVPIGLSISGAGMGGRLARDPKAVKILQEHPVAPYRIINTLLLTVIVQARAWLLLVGLSVSFILLVTLTDHHASASNLRPFTISVCLSLLILQPMAILMGLWVGLIAPAKEWTAGMAVMVTGGLMVVLGYILGVVLDRHITVVRDYNNLPIDILVRGGLAQSALLTCTLPTCLIVVGVYSLAVLLVKYASIEKGVY